MILDTSFLIDVLRGEESVAEWEHELDRRGDGVVTAITVMELWEGIHLTAATDVEQRRVRRLIENVNHAPFGRDDAILAGEYSAELTKNGRQIQIEDVMIGAIAAGRDETVLTRNPTGFERLPGVDVETY